MRGRIEIIVGSMSSGKTSELGRRLNRHEIARKSIKVFKPIIDNRYGVDRITDRNGTFSFEACNIPLELTEEVIKDILVKSKYFEIIGIDEVQFFDEGIITLVNRLRDMGKKVLLCGLDMNYKGEPFGHIGSLMAIACDVTKLHAVCVCCGKDAVFTQKLINGEPAPDGDVVQVGDVTGLQDEKDVMSYEARCVSCYVPPRKVNS